jgi:HPr kinase/phosphorylase
MAVVTPSITVEALLGTAERGAGIDTELLAGARGLDRQITVATSQKIGLALAGYDSYLRPGRVLIFGDSEVRFLSSLPPAGAREALRRVFEHDIPCVLLTNHLEALPELVEEAEAARMPVLRTRLATPAAIARLNAHLEDRLAPRDTLHGVLMDILGLGVLVMGESGIGKSECALDLVVRGHRLVADDAVQVRRRAETVLIGTCPDLTRHHMEIRGIGVINIRDMFGVASTRRSKRIELVVLLERWEPGREYERLGIDESSFEILGVSVPMVCMPVAPGRNLAILVEVAARNQLLRVRGQFAARKLVERTDRALRGQVDVSMYDLADDDPEDPR